MTAMEPTQDPCERCQETHPLTRFQPDHVHWYEMDAYSCPWCMRHPQPLLCARCMKAEIAEEMTGRPVSVGEQRVVGFLRRGAELDEQRRAS